MNVSSITASLWEYSSQQHSVQTDNSFTASFIAAQASVQASTATQPQTLEEFKKEMYAQINAIATSPGSTTAQISISITDKAFEKMMNDPAAKEEVLRLIERETRAVSIEPAFTHLSFDDDCVYSGAAGGSMYASEFATMGRDAFWRSSPNEKASQQEEKQAKRAEKRKADEKYFQEKAIEKKRVEKFYREKRLSELGYASTAIYPTDFSAMPGVASSLLDTLPSS